MSTEPTAVVRQLVSTDENDIILLVRGTDPQAIIAAAETFAVEDGWLIVEESAAEIRIGHIRAVPCNPDGHEIDGIDCDGSFTSHYVHGAPGRGSFSGAFVRVGRHKRAEAAR